MAGKYGILADAPRRNVARSIEEDKKWLLVLDCGHRVRREKRRERPMPPRTIVCELCPRGAT